MQIQKSQVREFFESIIIAGVLAFFIITFVVQSFVVQGHSMYPSLHDGERLFVNKFIYRFTEPKRGDIIVFSPKGEPGKKYIKRVIGLPGDHIEITKDGSVIVNGQIIKEDYINEKARYGIGHYTVPEKHVFVLGDNRNHSSDSRDIIRVGYVSYKSISGKAFWVYWPLNRIRILRNPEYNF
ncbi:signal peptidase I [Anoxybacter fermentans]|uniref:Signal peptidase I n=1 Tax=Anoxybacter fermentans TaxID=1323375 RepID=A0A3S9SXM9_9FIRM|nr:signal peptidase I [Anoxybacter fermentans]AZR73106.1 signal peptidase I [Anoxybacter fermentans]